MTRRFEEMFMDSGTEPFEFDGRLVHAAYRRRIEPGTIVAVEFLESRSSPVQGLELRVEKRRELAWDEHDAQGRSVRLWADKQDRATLRYVNPRVSSELMVWNIWLEERVGTESYEAPYYEIVQAWWAWSGMLVEEGEQDVLLRCSGSYDGPDFSDLVVRVSFEAP